MTVRDWQWQRQLSTCLVNRWLWNTYEVGVSTYGLTVRRWPQAETPRVTGLEPATRAARFLQPGAMSCDQFGRLIVRSARPPLQWLVPARPQHRCKGTRSLDIDGGPQACPHSAEQRVPSCRRRGWPHQQQGLEPRRCVPDPATSICRETTRTRLDAAPKTRSSYLQGETP